MTQHDGPEFRIHPSVVLQLGAQLISDRITALLELVKNAYDADSPDANITINTQTGMGGASYFPGALGFIEIEDHGVGMDLATLQRGWLTVSHSLKREMKASKQLTPKKRTPLGDKGLGRLGTQLLGKNVEIYTCAEGSDLGYHIGLSWADFETASDLGEVRVFVTETPKRQGTKLVISDLHDPDYWVREQQNLQRELSQVFFPFKQEQPRVFMTRVVLNGQRFDLEDAIERLRDSAPVRYKFQFDGQRLTISGRYRLNYLEGDTKKALDEYQRHIEKDQGASVFAYLEKNARFSGRFEFVNDKPGWFLRTWFEQGLEGLRGLERVNGQSASPGPFQGELDYFILSSGKNSAFDTVALYRAFVKGQSGLRVYRDGFAIRPYGFPDSKKGHDWLGFGQEATGGRSSYALKAQNTVGFISISASGNMQLTETTSREGFQVNPYFNTFVLLMEKVIDYINECNYELRTRSNAYVSALRQQDDEKSPPEQLRSLAAEAQPMQKAVKTLQGSFLHLIGQVNNDSHQSIPPTITSTKQPEPAVPDVNAETVGLLNSSKGLLGQIEEYLQRIEGLAREAERVEIDLQTMHDQVSDFSELAGLGLAAEAFTHELANITDGLRERTKNLLDHLRTQPLRDPVVVGYVNNVRHVIAAVRKQLSHLSPSLRYVREQRDRIEIAAFLSDYAAFQARRLSRVGISFMVERTDSSFHVRINRGKLMQVLDNLVLNSQYWLGKASEGGLTDLRIVVNATSPFIRVCDTGFGVDPMYENSLFEPFITGKPRREGRGLGLYIIRQLLDSDGCRVTLLPDRNVHGRRYIFQLDLSGACNS